MESIRDIYDRLWPDGYPDDYLPNDAVCKECSKLLGDHAAVIAELTKHKMSITGVLTCHCKNAPMRRAMMAGLPAGPNVIDRTFTSFQAQQGGANAFDAAVLLATGKATFSVLTLTGGPGRGKSHLLEAVAHQAIAQEARVQFVTCGHLMELLRSTQRDMAERTLEEILWVFESADLVCIDDIGAERVTDFGREHLLGIVESRYRRGARLAVATNMTREDMAKPPREGGIDARLASRLWDRNTGQTMAVPLTCPDYRLAKVPR